MNAHTYFEELLPFYAAGQLSGARQAEVQHHLAGCPACQADLKIWTAVSGEMGATSRAQAAPPALVDRALVQARSRRRFPTAVLQAGQLLQAQAWLIQPEMWPVSAAVMAIGGVVTMLSVQAEIIYFLAPLVAASTLAMLAGPEHDPAFELGLATPTSPWKILLARLCVVSGYNLLLALGATLGLLVFVPPGLLGTLILGWLGPLAFLSALALLLSLWWGTTPAIALTYGLWLGQYIPFKAVGLWPPTSLWETGWQAYQQFWHSPLILLLLAAFLVGLALVSARRPAVRLNQALG